MLQVSYTLNFDIHQSLKRASLFRFQAAPTISVLLAQINMERFSVPFEMNKKIIDLLKMLSLKQESCAIEDGVQVIYQKNPTVPTGTCAVLINGGERSLVANLAAANTFSAGHLKTAEAEAAINNSSIFYISGFFLTVSVEAILEIGKHAVIENKIFAMNLSAPFLIQFFGDQLAATLPYTDFVFGNESEAAAYGTAKGYGSDLSVIALKLAAQPKASGTRPRVVVFTQGSEKTIGDFNFLLFFCF